MGHHAAQRERVVIAPAEELLVRPRVRHQGNPGRLQHVSHGGPLVPGEPGLPRAAGEGIGPADHLDLQVRGHGREGQRRMIDVPPGSEQSELLCRHRGKEDAAAGPLAAGHDLGNLERGDDARRVVVGPVADAVRPRRPARVSRLSGDADVIVVAVHQDVLVAERRIRSAQPSNDVDAPDSRGSLDSVERRPARRDTPAQSSRGVGEGIEWDPLEVSAVTSRLEAQAGHFPRDHLCGVFCPRSSGQTSPKRVVGQLGKLKDHFRRCERHAGRRHELRLCRAAGACGAEEQGQAKQSGTERHRSPQRIVGEAKVPSRAES